LYRCNDDEYDDDGGGDDDDEYVEYDDEYEYDICLYYV
jgi:hypothetical protein